MDERYDENGNLKEKFVDSKTGIEYVLQGDYYIPNIVAPSNIKNFKLGKYGRLRLNYLKENKHIQYEIMKCEDTLIDHLKEVQELANKRYNQLMEEFKKRENITEELKQKDQMKWVGLMNNISNCVDEIVLKECIYDD